MDLVFPVMIAVVTFCSSLVSDAPISRSCWTKQFFVRNSVECMAAIQRYSNADGRCHSIPNMGHLVAHCAGAKCEALPDE